jgi:hypothetical protein
MDRLDGRKTEQIMSDDDRDRQSGRFLAGNSGGPGRPRRVIETDYLTALSEAVSLDAWCAVVGKALEQAQSGDAKAREWLSTYLLPRPGDTMQLTRMAAADELDFDLLEFETLDVFEGIQKAQGYVQMLQNFATARKAGRIDAKSGPTDLLRVWDRSATSDQF